MHLIDWYGASAGRDDLFDGDGTHLTEEGAQFYIDLVYQAVADQLPEHHEDEDVAVVKTPAELAVEEITATTRTGVEAAARNMVGPIS